MKESTDEIEKLSNQIVQLEKLVAEKEKEKLLAEKGIQGETERANIAEKAKENIERSLTKLQDAFDEYKKVAGQIELKVLIWSGVNMFVSHFMAAVLVIFWSLGSLLKLRKILWDSLPSKKLFMVGPFIFTTPESAPPPLALTGALAFSENLSSISAISTLLSLTYFHTISVGLAGSIKSRFQKIPLSF